jgi:hypothetical protein
MTLNQAAQANAQIRELTCEELKAANDEARSKETTPGFSGGAHTTAYRQDASGAGKYMKAMCPSMPRKKFADGYQKSLAPDAQQPNCSGSPPRTAGSGRVNDAENKILHPEMAAGKGGMIKLSTVHSPGDAAPCLSCRRAICEAETCGIEVWLCKSEKTPPEAVRPAAEGLCPPKTGPGHGDYDTEWQAKGLGTWP